MVFGGGGFDLGTAYGKIVLSLDDSAVQNARQSIGAGLKDIGASVTSLGASLTTLTAPVLAFSLTGLKAASDFDTVINQIRVFGELGPRDLEQVRQAALKWGADTKFSALDASAGMLDLLKSGQSVEQAMATMPGVLNLAGAGNINLAQSAGIVSTALAQFRLSADQAGTVANSFARAANASRADVTGLGEAMVDVGPVAAQFGLSFDDTNATLATFSNNGIMGAEAGTKLRTMLINMTETTIPVKAAWTELGISIYDANGNTRDFNTVLVELDAALDKLPVQRQNELMVTLAGTYGLTGLSALRAAGGIDEMRQKMEEAPDAATVAAEFMNSFAGKVESLTGSIQTLQIEAITPLMNEALAPMVDQIIGLVNGLTLWIQQNPELAGQIVRILGVLVVVGPALVIVGMAISAVGTTISGLGAVIGTLMGPVGLLIAGAALLFIAFQENFLGIRDILQPIFDNVVIGFETLVGVIGNFGNIVANQGLGEAIGSIINAFMQMFGLIGNDEMSTFAQSLGENIVNAFISVVSFIQDVVIPIVERFVGLLVDFWESIQPGLNAFFNWVTQEALPLVVDFFNTVLRPAVEGIVNMLMDIWEVVSPALSALFNWFMAEGLPWITDALRWFMENILQPAISLLQGIWEAVGPVLQDVFDWFVTVGLPAINDALTWFKDNILTPVISLLQGIWEAVGPVLQDVFDWFTVTGIPFIQAAIDYLKVTYLDPLIAILKGIWDAVKPGLEAVYNWFRDAFQWIGQTFVQPVLDFIGKIPAVVQGSINELIRLADAVINNPIMQLVNPTMASAAAIWNQSKATLLGSGVDMMNLQQQDSGGPGIADLPYLIGPSQTDNEIFVPRSEGQFIPNFMDIMKQMAGSGGGDTINLNVPVEMLRDEPNLERNARTFAEKFAEAKRSMG